MDGQGREMNGAYYPAVGLTSARMTYTCSGDIEGTGTAVAVMSYGKGRSPSTTTSKAGRAPERSAPPSRCGSSGRR